MSLQNLRVPLQEPPHLKHLFELHWNTDNNLQGCELRNSSGVDWLSEEVNMPSNHELEGWCHPRYCKYQKIFELMFCGNRIELSLIWNLLLSLLRDAEIFDSNVLEVWLQEMGDELPVGQQPEIRILIYNYVSEGRSLARVPTGSGKSWVGPLLVPGLRSLIKINLQFLEWKRIDVRDH